MQVMRFLKAAAVALAGGLIALGATAQTFPSKNVSLVVPYPAGGSGDYFARLIQPEYQKRLGQVMIVENIGGASGALGVQKVLAAPADGNVMYLAFEHAVAAAQWQQVTCAASARAEDDAWRVELRPGASPADLAAAIVAQGWRLRELRPAAQDLERLFLRVVSASDERAAA